MDEHDSRDRPWHLVDRPSPIATTSVAPGFGRPWRRRAAASTAGSHPVPEATWRSDQVRWRAEAAAFVECWRVPPRVYLSSGSIQYYLVGEEGGEQANGTLAPLPLGRYRNLYVAMGPKSPRTQSVVLHAARSWASLLTLRFSTKKQEEG